MFKSGAVFIEGLKKFYHRWQEAILYLFFGVLTTLVNIVIYGLCNRAFGADKYLLNNVAAWVVAVLFAYFTNKRWVFRSQSWDRQVVGREFFSFVAARLFSLGVEEVMLFVMVDRMNMKAMALSFAGLSIGGEMIAKIIAEVVVVILNYVFSKLIVFRKK